MFEHWNFEFYNPWFLCLFVVFIPLLYRDFKKNKNKGILVPTVQNMLPDNTFWFIRSILSITKYLLLASLIIAFSRPRTFSISQDRDDTKGVDILLTVDVSLSMLTKDLEPNRLEALKDIAKAFINSHPNDRIGIVTYAAEAISKVPITLDHQAVLEELDQLNTSELAPGTSIGDGLANAVSHLKNSQAKSKIIILMTDGVNTINNGIPPMVATELAKSNNIKVYTIGIGTNGYALMPTSIDFFGELLYSEVEVKIDEPTLQEIAQETGGKYYRATSNESLQEVYSEINQLEKSVLKSNMIYNYKEHFRYFLWIAVITLLIDALLRWLLYKTLL